MKPPGLAVAEGSTCVELAEHEPLRGTAPKSTPTWILLEYSGAWESDAVASSTLPAAVKERLEQWPEQHPGCRVALIRQPGRDSKRPLCFISHAGDGPREPWLLSIALGGYEDLLAIDFAALLRTGAHEHGERRGPLHLVCTHGRRDACCAIRGVAVYEAMAREAGPLEVWHASHVGGHRFAANVVSLPEAICYGRVEANEAKDLLEAHRRSEIYALSRLRGRSAQSRVVQAAECLLREELGHLRIAGIDLVSARQDGDVHEVVLRVQGEPHLVRLQTEELPPRPASCGDAPTPAMAWRRAGE